MQRYENLANAIIESAVLDYKKALRYIKRNPRPQYINPFDKKDLKKSRKWAKSLRRIWECETFFLGEWYHALTKIDGKTMIGYIHESLKINSANFYRKAAMPPKRPAPLQTKTIVFRRNPRTKNEDPKTIGTTKRKPVIKNQDGSVAKNADTELNIGFGMKKPTPKNPK